MQLSLFFTTYLLGPREPFKRDIAYLAIGATEGTRVDFSQSVLEVWHWLPLHPERKVLFSMIFPAPQKKGRCTDDNE